ncbi:hypothetical protein M569_09507 [Genlisea aurea]|uniref:Pentacotripeptide-repeat region of PRORP domain-containing protein n=1 Tax=Genlisea aurea TaxID=192259 RepID=S8CE88_9LAMI|nr:hypothetical protein M569_09507 [Genlisea aurea]
MILKLGIARQVDEMEAFCNEMVRLKFNCNIIYDSLSNVIHSLIRSSRLTEALRILYVMNCNGFKATLGLFNLLMDSVVAERRGFEDALFVYKEMVRSQVLPNVDTLNCLIIALFESGRVDAALDQFRRFRKKGCSPNIQTFEIVITRLAAKNLFRESVAILQEMKDSGMIPTYGICSALIRCLCDHLRVDSEIEVLDGMMDSGTFSALVLCSCEAGNAASALSLFRHMVSKDWVLDPVSYSQFVRCLSEEGKSFFIEEAYGVFLYMSHKGCRLDDSSLSTLIRSMCTFGDVKNAMKLLFWTDASDSESIFIANNNLLRRLLSDSNREIYVRVMLSRMIVSGSTFESETRRNLIRWLSSSRRRATESAYVFSSTMRDDESFVPDSETLDRLLSCLCESRRVESFVRCVRERGSRFEALDRDAYRVIIDRLWRGGYERESRFFVELMLEKHLIPDIPMHQLVVKRRVDDEIGFILEEGLKV